MSAPELRKVREEDWGQIASIFWDTFVLGSPVPFDVTQRMAYEDLVLGWYKEQPQHSRVVAVGDRVVGYVLVCVDQRQFEKDQHRSGFRYVRRVAPTLVGPGISREERKFLFSRLVDGYEAWRDEDPKGVGAHAHFNVAGGYRSGLWVRDFVEHIDDACRTAGLTHWTGQINAREGRRLGLLLRYGFHVETRTPNRTLSWLTGSRVERLTVVREIGDIQRIDLAS